MSQFQTHYDNLKVARNAPPEVIRAAYKSLSQKFHPDHHQDKADSTRAFQLISAAYKTLSDPQQREQHDLWIARTEAQLWQAAAASRSRRAEDRLGQHIQKRKASQPSQSVKQAVLHPVLQPVQFAWLLRSSRSIAFLTSVILISVMLIMLFHS
jgi:DnaJ-class molecular chaperone